MCDVAAAVLSQPVAGSVSRSLHWFVKSCQHTSCITIDWNASVPFTGVKWSLRVEREVVCVNADLFYQSWGDARWIWFKARQMVMVVIGRNVPKSHDNQIVSTLKKF